MGRLNKSNPKLNTSIRYCAKIACHGKNYADLQISQSCAEIALRKIAILNGTNYVSLALFVNSRTVRCCSVTFSQFSILVCFSVYA